MNASKFRHIGTFVKDINKISYCLSHLGFSCFYDKEEKDYGRIKKLTDGKTIIELIQSVTNKDNYSCHFCFEMEPPKITNFIGKLEKGNAYDLNVNLWFWMVDDIVYFEFCQFIERKK